jgi:uncharacterized protein involved in cysteine biosynthesis
MLDRFLLAIRDALAPAQRQALLVSIGATLLIFVALWAGVGWGLARIDLAEYSWLRWPLEILGHLAVWALAWVLFPAVATTILSFFLDGVLNRLDALHYPTLPPAHSVPVRAMIGSGVRLLALTVGLNLLALPVYLAFPAINLFLFYGLNGYLLSREYFDLVALRRLDGVAAKALWREHRGRWFLAGVAIAILLSLPVVNLAAPLVAAAFMLHLVTGHVIAGREGMAASGAAAGSSR